MIIRNPVKDKVAIVGVGTTKYARDLGGKTAGTLAIEACKNAILDAGLTAKDIDGICGPAGGVTLQNVQEGLGIPAVSYFSTPPIVYTFPLVASVNAVFSGTCTTALLYHSRYRGPGNSRSAARDIFRVRAAAGAGGGTDDSFHGQYKLPYGGGGVYGDYSGWMRRYMSEFGTKREHFGLIPINNRSWAAQNEHAVLRTPLTMEDYLNARMIRDPMCMLDMDLPVDGGDALVVTTAERARDLAKKPVYIHAATMGQQEHNEDDLSIDINHLGQNVVTEVLWQKSDLKLEDMNAFYPYDGYTIITMNWLENVGFCKKGEGGPYLESCWDKNENRAKLMGHIAMNTHGGSLSDGATQGAGHTREAVIQLRGEAGERQVPNCKAALVTPGGFFFNSTGFILRAD